MSNTKKREMNRNRKIAIVAILAILIAGISNGFLLPTIAKSYSIASQLEKISSENAEGHRGTRFASDEKDKTYIKNEILRDAIYNSNDSYTSWFSTANKGIQMLLLVVAFPLFLLLTTASVFLSLVLLYCIAEAKIKKTKNKKALR